MMNYFAFFAFCIVVAAQATETSAMRNKLERHRLTAQESTQHHVRAANHERNLIIKVDGENKRNLGENFKSLVVQEDDVDGIFFRELLMSMSMSMSMPLPAEPDQPSASPPSESPPSGGDGTEPMPPSDGDGSEPTSPTESLPPAESPVDRPTSSNPVPPGPPSETPEGPSSAATSSFSQFQYHHSLGLTGMIGLLLFHVV
jgi:hypothetical protein